MTEFETMVLVFLLLVAVASIGYYKLKKSHQRMQAMFEEANRKHIEEMRQLRIKHREDRLAAFGLASSGFIQPARSNSGFVQPIRTTSRTVASTYTSSPRTAVVDNSSNDMLTAMIIQDSLNSSQYEPPTRHYSNTSDSVDFPAATPEPSYTSGYSSPSSSYSSSNSDSSYSSSYSSSSDSSSSDSGSSSD